MSLEPYTQRKLLDYLLNNTAASFADNFYLAVLTNATYSSGDTPVEPSDAPVSDSSYARITLARNTTVWPASSTTDYVTTTSNAAALSFPTATKNWGTIRYLALFDASTGGNLIWVGAVNPQTTIVTGQTFTIAAEKLIASLD